MQKGIRGIPAVQVRKVENPMSSYYINDDIFI